MVPSNQPSTPTIKRIAFPTCRQTIPIVKTRKKTAVLQYDDEGTIGTKDQPHLRARRSGKEAKRSQATVQHYEESRGHRNNKANESQKKPTRAKTRNNGSATTKGGHTTPKQHHNQQQQHLQQQQQNLQGRLRGRSTRLRTTFFYFFLIHQDERRWILRSGRHEDLVGKSIFFFSSSPTNQTADRHHQSIEQSTNRCQPAIEFSHRQNTKNDLPPRSPKPTSLQNQPSMEKQTKRRTPSQTKIKR